MVKNQDRFQPPNQVLWTWKFCASVFRIWSYWWPMVRWCLLRSVDALDVPVKDQHHQRQKVIFIIRSVWKTLSPIPSCSGKWVTLFASCSEKKRSYSAIVVTPIVMNLTVKPRPSSSRCTREEMTMHRPSMWMDSFSLLHVVWFIVIGVIRDDWSHLRAVRFE
jgi:hypothetical protein